MTTVVLEFRPVLVAPVRVVRLHTPGGTLREHAGGSGLTAAVASGYGVHTLDGPSGHRLAARGRVSPSARIEG